MKSLRDYPKNRRSVRFPDSFKSHSKSYQLLSTDHDITFKCSDENIDSLNWRSRQKRESSTGLDRSRLKTREIEFPQLKPEAISVLCSKMTNEELRPSLLPNCLLDDMACFNNSQKPTKITMKEKISYEKLKQGVKYQVQPPGYCESHNCQVRLRWVKLVRQHLQQRTLQTNKQAIQLTNSQILQIRNDSARTFVDLKSDPTNINLQKSRAFEKTLEKVLREYARQDPQVGYVQGMNLIAGVLLNHLKEYHLTYRTFELLMKRHRLRDLFVNDFKEMKFHCIEIFYRHLKKLAPHVYNHMRCQQVKQFITQIDPLQFMPPWLLSLFGCVAQIEHLHSIIDGFLKSGYAFLYRLSLCYLLYLEKDILASGDESLIFLGSTHGRGRNIPWGQVIAASNNVDLL